MQTLHYGTKAILAVAMTRLEYNEYRGWDLPADEDGSDAGFLVEYLDGGARNHPDHQGYISWSPADVFAKAYKPSGQMSFGHAIEAAKEGHKIGRSGWNGKNMWVALTPGSVFDARHAKDGHAAKHRANELQDALPLDGTENVIELLPHFDMRAADGTLVVGWLASQSDMLAEDWQIVD